MVSGILLYWAEGAKFTKAPSIEFTNTDSQMIRLMMKFFREILNVSENKFALTARIYEGGDLKKAEKYWLSVTGISKNSLKRPEILQLSKDSKSLKKYPYGMCRIGVYNILAYRKLIALIEEFSKKIK